MVRSCPSASPDFSSELSRMKSNGQEHQLDKNVRFSAEIRSMANDREHGVNGLPLRQLRFNQL